MVVGAVEAKSPAAEAGLAAGDVITAIDNKDIQRPLDFQRAMLDRKPGEKLQLAIRRAGESLTLNITLGDVPDAVKPSSQPAWELLGVELKPIAPDEFRKNHQTRYRGGLLVTAVRPDSPAAGEGIVPGDVLVGMHIWETVTLENVAYILKQSDFANLSPVKFFILRGDETLYGYLPLAPPRRPSDKRGFRFRLLHSVRRRLCFSITPRRSRSSQRQPFTGDCPDFRGGKDVTRELTFSPRKWDCPPCAVKGDRSMFLADVFCAKHDFPPKNGPVPIQAVNAYSQRRYAEA